MYVTQFHASLTGSHFLRIAPMFVPELKALVLVGRDDDPESPINIVCHNPFSDLAACGGDIIIS